MYTSENKVRHIVAQARGEETDDSAPMKNLGAYDDGNPTANVSITNEHPTKVLKFAKCFPLRK